MCCTTGTANHMGEMMCLHVFMQTHTLGTWRVFHTLGKGRRHSVDASLSVPTFYVEQRPAPLGPPASPSPLLSPDLVYLIDFYPVGHLSNTEQVLHVRAPTCVWSKNCSVYINKSRLRLRFYFLLTLFSPFPIFLFQALIPSLHLHFSSCPSLS